MTQQAILTFSEGINATYSAEGWQCDDPRLTELLAWYTPEQWALEYPLRYTPDMIGAVAQWAADSLQATVTSLPDQEPLEPGAIY